MFLKSGYLTKVASSLEKVYSLHSGINIDFRPINPNSEMLFHWIFDIGRSLKIPPQDHSHLMAEKTETWHSFSNFLKWLSTTRVKLEPRVPNLILYCLFHSLLLWWFFHTYLRFWRLAFKMVRQLLKDRRMSSWSLYS